MWWQTLPGEAQEGCLERPLDLVLKGELDFSRCHYGKSIASKRHSKKKGGWCSGKARNPVG